MSSRNLGQSEARKLLKLQPKPVASNQWPGEYNLALIAEAVDHRRKFVDLDGKQFSIKYDERQKAVFIKPTDDFAPCGWIEYKTLKEALVA